MKPNETVAKLVELRQNGWSRHPHAAAWRAHYTDYRTTLTTELRRSRDPDALPRLLDTLTAEIAILRDRQAIPPAAPLRTTDPFPDGIPLGGDTDITITRGQPAPVVLTAIDRLTALLDGDWVLIISGSSIHATVRPVRETPGNGAQRPEPGGDLDARRRPRHPTRTHQLRPLHHLRHQRTLRPHQTRPSRRRRPQRCPPSPARRRPHMTAPLCFLDTETDGIHPDRKIWEVAAIRREPDGREHEYQAFIDIDLRTADPFGLRVGRFYDRHPWGRYLSGKANTSPYDRKFDEREITLPEDAAAEVARLTHGAHIVGAVPNFDTEALSSLLRAHTITSAWHYHLIDVENLAAGYLAGQGHPESPPWNSDVLSTLLGLKPVPDDERHTALGDARWAMRVYDAVMGTT